MMWQVFVATIDPQIDHESRTREVQLLEAIIGIAPAVTLIQQMAHAVREVGIDDHEIGGDALTRCQLQARRPSVGGHDAFHRRIAVDRDAEILCGAGHRLRQRAEAADRMPDAIGELEERDQAEHARAARRVHAEVLRGIAQRIDDALVGEVAPEMLVQALPGAERQGCRQLEGIEISGDRAHRGAEIWLIADDVLLDVFHIPAVEARRQIGPQRRQLGTERLEVRRQIEHAVVPEAQAGIRRHAVELDIRLAVQATIGEQLIVDPRHLQDRRPGIKAVRSLIEPAHPPADAGVCLVDRDVMPGGGQAHSAGEAARAGADESDGSHDTFILRRILDAGQRGCVRMRTLLS